MADLPKNVAIVQYKNADGSKQVKYRARVMINGETHNQLFNTLEEAKTWLTEARSHYGRKGIVEHDLAEQKAIEDARKPLFKKFFGELYFKDKHVNPDDVFKKEASNEKLNDDEEKFLERAKADPNFLILQKNNTQLTIHFLKQF